MFFFQGTAAVTLAGLIAALPLDSGNTSMADHRFLFQGAGEVRFTAVNPKPAVYGKL